MSTEIERRHLEEENLILTLGLALPRRVPRSWVRVTAFIPTHRGHFTRDWPLNNGVMSSSVLEDMGAWVFGTIQDSVWLKGIRTVEE